MFKKTALVAGLGLALSAAAQADYRVEIAPALTGGDLSSVGVEGTFYLKNVDTSKGPLGEAAFTSKASSVSASYFDGETDSDFVDDVEFENAGAAGRFVFGEGNWIVDAGYEHSETELPGARRSEDFELDQYSIGLGKYLGDNTTLVVSYLNSEADEGDDVDSYRADLEHLFHWGDNSGLKLAAAYGYTEVDRGDDIDVYEIEGTWYICKNLGIGAGYSNTDQDGLELEEYGAFAEYFIGEGMAVSLGYIEGEIEDADIETDSYSVGFRARF